MEKWICCVPLPKGSKTHFGGIIHLYDMLFARPVSEPRTMPWHLSSLIFIVIQKPLNPPYNLGYTGKSAG